MIIIIGGSGFIGTRLSTQLQKDNIPFKIVDIEKSAAFPDHWEFGDVTKPESLVEPLTGSDVIINRLQSTKIMCILSVFTMM